jgi:tripartite-type tricarboxylate transporter receptor subunit TctC
VIRRRTLIATAAAAALPLRLAAQAGAYPNRPIKIVVPLPPGGSPDVMARLLAEKLQPVLGQPIVVENKVGANGNIAREFVARQAADGYTLMLSETGHVMSASFYPKLGYDPIKDFEPIALTSKIPFLLAVHPSLPVHTLKEFIALAKAQPGKLNYGSSGMGAPHHFAGELLKSMTGIEIVHVPYKGSAAIVPALISGEISFVIGAINSLLPHIRSGRIRPIAIAGSSRTQVMPELPTMAEAGPLPGYAVEVWLGLLAPAGTPRAIVERLNAEANRMVRDADVVKERLLPIGLDPVGSTPEELGAVMKSDLEKFARIAKAANMKSE